MGIGEVLWVGLHIRRKAGPEAARGKMPIPEPGMTEEPANYRREFFYGQRLAGSEAENWQIFGKNTLDLLCGFERSQAVRWAEMSVFDRRKSDPLWAEVTDFRGFDRDGHAAI